MQTFLTSSDFQENASILDSKRLVKQVLETKQIFNTITGLNNGWKNHPICKMWAGYDFCLLFYGYYISKECQKRDFKYNDFFEREINKTCQVKQYNKPEWLHLSVLHDSHKSKLLFKGKVDAICAAIKKYNKIKNINLFLKNLGFKEKNFLKHPQVQFLERYCLDNNIEIGKNWYSQFNWGVLDNLPYFWFTDKNDT